MPVIIFSPKDYENLARNQQDILLALRQQVSVISYYKRCLERVEKFTPKEDDGQ